MAISASITAEPGLAVVAVSGEIDYADAENLQYVTDALDPAVPVMIDLSPVEFADASLIWWLISTARRVAHTDPASPRLAVITQAPHLRRLLSRTGADLTIPTVDHARDARQLLLQSPPAATMLWLRPGHRRSTRA